MQTYFEKLKSPKWQKRRLEILSRDNFMCVLCNNTEDQLHVHHKKYFQGQDPWEYSDNMLITLCDKCHKKIHNVIPGMTKSDIDKVNRFTDRIPNYLCKHWCEIIDIIERALGNEE